MGNARSMALRAMLPFEFEVLRWGRGALETREDR